MTTTKFKGLTIKHPHSGKVTQSKIETAIIHNRCAFHDHLDRKQRVDWAVKDIKQSYGSEAIVTLADVDYSIRVEMINPF